MKTKITAAYVIEGNVYEFIGEDGLNESCSYQVGVDASDGRRLILAAYVSRGDCVNEDGYRCVAYGAKGAAQRLAARIQAAGIINEALWVVAPEPLSYEEREEAEFARELMDGERC